jgi:methionyl-tRNA formyltransferase
MRILYLGNNWVGWRVLRWLKEQGEEIVGLVIHPAPRQKYVGEMLEIAALPSDRVFDGSQLRQRQVLESIRALGPDIGISILFGYILKPVFLDMFHYGVINLHPAFLPHNRGAYPNVWSIVEGTPAGATLHYIDVGVDTGDIIAQQQVPVDLTDTGGALYHKLERACVELFKETWPLIRHGQAPRISQDRTAGTYHRTQDVESIDHIDLDRSYTARELIDVIRARTFPPYPGAYFVHQGRRVYVRLQLLYEQHLNEGGGS